MFVVMHRFRGRWHVRARYETIEEARKAKDKNSKKNPGATFRIVETDYLSHILS